MKTFLNVLYRRILYKIPLKLLLILIAVFGILFACFSNADNIILYDGLEGSYYNTNVFENPFYDTLNEDIYLLCINNNSVNSLSIWIGNSNLIINPGNNYSSCVGVDKYIQDVSVIVNGSQGYSIYNISYMKASEFNSLNCQTEYNLIPISSVDSNYCTTNNLCPSQECPSVPIGTGNLTQLYINNILHVGAPTILMNIPDEIDWDYAYTMGGNIMNIDIVGYNVDYQVVEDEITIQKYKPSSDELSGIISGLIPLFVPGLCIILLLYFIFKFIKKIF